MKTNPQAPNETLITMIAAKNSKQSISFTKQFDENIYDAGPLPNAFSIIAPLGEDHTNIEFHEIRNFIIKGNLKIHEGKVHLNNASNLQELNRFRKMFSALGTFADMDIRVINQLLETVFESYLSGNPEEDKIQLLKNLSYFTKLLSTIEICSKDILNFENDLLLISNHLSLGIK